MLIFWVLSLHEFWQSGTVYRLYWARGIEFLLIFFLLAIGVYSFAQRLKFYICLAVFLVLSWEILEDFKRHTQKYLVFNGEQEFSTNPQGWFVTVN